MQALSWTPDNIMMNGEYSQNDCNTVLMPSDIINKCGGHLYITPTCHNSEIFELKENKYYLWINEHEFWITEWLLMKANISQTAADELLHYIHKNSGNMVKIHIQRVCDIKKYITNASYSVPVS